MVENITLLPAKLGHPFLLHRGYEKKIVPHVMLPLYMVLKCDAWDAVKLLTIKFSDTPTTLTFRAHTQSTRSTCQPVFRSQDLLGSQMCQSKYP